MTLMIGIAMVAGTLACSDGGGGGSVTAYCNALCEYTEECADWLFEETWDDHNECVAECREDVIDNQDDLGQCTNLWLSYQTCYFQAYADDCDGDDVWETCEDKFERLEDCWDDHDQEQIGSADG
jgi:hypothetical protein